MVKINQNTMAVIEVLINHASIIAIESGDEPLFFTAESFQESSANNVGSIDFNTISGRNITEFIKINVVGQGSVQAGAHQQILSKFMDWVTPRQKMQIKINKTVQYVMFSM